MTLAPLLAAPPAVQVHAWAAIACLLPTAAIWLMPKGTPIHKMMGGAFLVLMGVTAVSSFWIRDLFNGWPSPIHLLSLNTIIGLPIAIMAVWRGYIDKHRKAMLGMSLGLVIAGLFTMLPSRIMGAVVFGW